MENYPRTFSRNIETTFGEEGRLWLKNLDKLLADAVSKWKLTKCLSVENLSFNYVCTAESPDFGPVIVKLGVIGREVEHENRALSRLAAENICRCYDYDSGLQALLLEQVIPGKNLYSLPSAKEQIEEGAAILRRMPMEIRPEDDFPYYRDWLKKSFDRVRDKYSDADRIKFHFSRAESYFGEIEESDLSESILHGDFHHQNILRNGEGRWILIDPKGVIGFRTSDCGRFILNQLDVLEKEDHYQYLKRMAQVFAKALDTSESLILKGALTEQVLSCSWSLEGDISQGEKESVLIKLDYAWDLYDSILKEYEGQ